MSDQWNIARIVAAHDCNHGQIPDVAVLIAQLEAFHADELARLRAENKALLDTLKDCQGYLSAIENAANQIGERSAIQSKLGRIRAHLAQHDSPGAGVKGEGP